VVGNFQKVLKVYPFIVFSYYSFLTKNIDIKIWIPDRANAQRIHLHETLLLTYALNPFQLARNPFFLVHVHALLVVKITEHHCRLLLHLLNIDQISWELKSVVINLSHHTNLMLHTSQVFCYLKDIFSCWCLWCFCLLLLQC
jgi:hypothetical protein